MTLGGPDDLSHTYRSSKSDEILPPHLGKRSKTPITALCRDGGTPPPPSPHHGKRPAKKLTEKKSRQRGVPPPPSRQAAWNFFAKNGVFCLKNTVFGPIFNRFFNHGKGGYPPHPHHGTRPAKKLTEKKSRQGGVPPPITAQSRDWGF